MIPLTSPASRKRVLFGHWPFALLSSAPGSVWACGGASLVVAENGGGRGGMPDHNGPTFEEITSGVRFRNRSPPLRSPGLLLFKTKNVPEGRRGAGSFPAPTVDQIPFTPGPGAFTGTNHALFNLHCSSLGGQLQSLTIRPGSARNKAEAADDPRRT